MTTYKRHPHADLYELAWALRHKGWSVYQISQKLGRSKEWLREFCGMVER